MEYEDALKLWASRKYDISLVNIKTVSLDIEEGYSAGCCGGGEDSYHSLCYDSDPATISVYIKLATGKTKGYEISKYSFGELIQEIVAASNGV